MDKNYAFIVNSKVVNIVVFNDPSQELLDLFKKEHNLDEIVLVESKGAAIGGTYDGVHFIPPKFYDSWIWDIEKEVWLSPVKHPDYDGKDYAWNETTLSWVEIES